MERDRKGTFPAAPEAGRPVTVTAWLEGLVEEPVYADKLRQERVAATDPNDLDVDPGHPLIHRVTVLRGARSARPYLYAEVMLVMSRLPVAAGRQLETTGDPIGRVLVAHGVEPHRVWLPSDPRPEPRFPAVTAGSGDVRAYRLVVGKRPVMIIREWFLPELVGRLPPLSPVSARGGVSQASG